MSDTDSTINRTIDGAVDCTYYVNGDLAGDKPVLFLIHGIGSWHHTWDSLLPRLTESFTVVTYDLRGHGDSPVPTGPFGLDDLVDDLEHLRATLGVEQAHFAGHSLGGMIGPAYARRFPQRVLSVGLLSTAAFRTEDDSAKVRGVVATMEAEGIGNVLPTLTNRWFTDAFADNNPDIIDARLERVMATPADIFLQVFHVYANTEMSPYLGELRMPTLVLTGENDGGCNPRLNHQIAAALPNSTLVILPDYKHSILLEAGPVVAEQLATFLESL